MIGHPPIGLVFEELVVECPVCGTPVIAHRILGVRSASGCRWLAFFPHVAPCGLRCVAGGILRRHGNVHTGPETCEVCTSGQHEAPNVDLVLIDETGDLELAWGSDDSDDSDGGEGFDDDTGEDRNRDADRF